MKKQCVPLLLLVWVLLSCSPTDAPIQKEVVSIVPSKIYGSWYLNKWTMYHTLVFRDSSLYADNTVDTLYMFNYEIKQDTLFSYMWNQHFKNRILRLSDDSLVVDGIFDAKERRIYSRVNTGFR